MARRWILPAVLVVSAAIPSVAYAEEASGCPPGGWFCEDLPSLGSDADEATSDDASGRAAPAPPPPRATTPRGPTKPPPRPPPRRVYAYPYLMEPPPPPPPRRDRPEIGLQLRLQGALMDGRKAPESGMGGLGLSLRPRPTPHFAFDIGVDALGGIDYNGNPRTEGAVSFNPMVFLNPRDKAQVYLLAGLGFAGASVEFPDGSLARYSYVGFDAGLGVEFRLSRRVALDLDLIGFIRGRIDRDADLAPEFVDPDTGRTTNTSGGGLLRFGIAFYW